MTVFYSYICFFIKVPPPGWGRQEGWDEFHCFLGCFLSCTANAQGVSSLQWRFNPSLSFRLRSHSNLGFSFSSSIPRNSGKVLYFNIRLNCEQICQGCSKKTLPYPHISPFLPCCTHRFSPSLEGKIFYNFLQELPRWPVSPPFPPKSGHFQVLTASGSDGAS